MNEEIKNTETEMEKTFEFDIPTTTKKDKTETVVHKTSGKELVIVDTPSAIKEYKRMDYYIGGSK